MIDRVKTLRRLAAALLLGTASLASGQTAPAPAPAPAPATAPATEAPRTATIAIHADRPGPVYDRRIFTQFAEHLGTGIYGGLWVGANSNIPNTRGFRNDVLRALKTLGVPVVRWPGGCFADEYHWREGIGAPKSRPVKVNTNWGGVTESNRVGTHEFMDLVGLLGAEPYISGNVGNGTPQEMAEWVEYITAPAGSLADLRARNGHKQPWALPYFGIGNELWGCGGNMRAEYAADVTRRYSTFIKAPASTRILKIASGANSDDVAFTDTMMRVAGGQLDALSLHYYTVPGGWPPRASATVFDETGWAQTLSETLRMDDLIAKHSAAMDKYDPARRVWLAVDEWGTWYAGDPGTNPGFLRQQNTLRDALVAAINLNIFAKHADRVKMTAIAQMVDVLQAMILTEGTKMVLTPTYHVFDMYRPYMDGTVLPIEVASPWYKKDQYVMPAISASAVRGKDGMVRVAFANLDPNHAVPVAATLDGVTAGAVEGQLLTAPAINSLNSFDAPATVAPVAFAGARFDGNRLGVVLPPRSVVMLTLR